MATPDVSVIIPAYNLENYIVRALDSVLAQEGVELEVIVVDDVSTDNTVAIVRGIGDPRIRIVMADKNGGCGASRNKGIAQAQGRWISIVDGDDVLLPGRLARMVALGEAEKADMVADNLMIYRELDGSSEPMFSTRALVKARFATLSMLMQKKYGIGAHYPFSYIKPMVRAEFLKRVSLKYYEDIPIGEDYLFIAEGLARGAKCVIDPNCGYQYTVRPTSISYRVPAASFAGMLEKEQAFKAQYKMDGKTRAMFAWRQFYLKEMLVYGLAVDAIKARDWKGAVKIVAAFPTSLRLFWEPVWVRLKRIFVKSPTAASVA